MKLYKTAIGAYVTHNDACYSIGSVSFDELLGRDDLREHLLSLLTSASQVGDEASILDQPLLAPIGNQEIWAAGVTYLRSRDARMEESRESGGDTFYDKVYEAERPELFFKSPGWRAVGPGGAVRIRRDSTWDVPEPELTLVISSSGLITGYTIGNDMSSRSIEGENPLYLPQAKCYDGAAAIGPCIYLPSEALPPSTTILISISRDGSEVFSGSTTISQMKRSHTELVSYLFRELSFPSGAFLMTGTCVVPGNEFTLQPKDVVAIEIDGIGNLQSHVA